MKSLSENDKRNIAIHYYKDRGMVLKTNDEVHFAGGLAGWHNGVKMVDGRMQVLFVPSGKMNKETLDKKFGANHEH